jgi:dTDP-4-amino-4,6-dideoxygalactose transaminase
MTSGSWSRHTGETTGYDVLELGFNHRPDEPRAALAASRWRRLEAEVAARRALTAAYRAALAPLAGALRSAFADEAVARSSCAAMVVLLHDARRRDRVREALLRRGVRSGLLSAAPGAPRAQATAAAALALPLFPALGAAGVERVAAALAGALDRGAAAR